MLLLEVIAVLMMIIVNGFFAVAEHAMGSVRARGCARGACGNHRHRGSHDCSRCPALWTVGPDASAKSKP